MPTKNEVSATASLDPSRANVVLDTRAAAAFLGVSPRTLEGFRVRGGGPRYTKVGRAVRYRIESLQEYLRQQERASTSDPGRGVA
jgi:hypothetical protein